MDSPADKADLLIITALYKEMKWVKRVFNISWQGIEQNGTYYYQGSYPIDNQNSP